MALPRPARPSVLIADLRAFFGTRSPHQVVFAAIAVAMPMLLVLGFTHDSKPEPRGPEIIYVQSWRADRSDAEIQAQQKIDSKLLAAAREKRRQEWARVADSMGIKH